MFHRRDGLYRASNLDALGWLDHGFGTLARDQWVPADRAVTLRQIHSAICFRADGAPGCLGEGDALYANQPGSWLVVRTADCVPVILADARQRAVAVIHAGWRGAAEGVVERALDRMQAEFATDPADIAAAIGPAIQRCCFEVGPEVAERFGASGRTCIDLAGTIVRQLESRGVKNRDIANLGACTRCAPGQFHSYRRDREASGRMQSAARILP